MLKLKFTNNVNYSLHNDKYNYGRGICDASHILTPPILTKENSFNEF